MGRGVRRHLFPAEYGGLGLTPEHQRAFDEETAGFDMPFSLNVPTLGILAAILVDHGTHEQKLRHLPAILKGEEVWVQMLSEPSGGSDLAGVLTRADRDGELFVLNGSKIWSSGADAADRAMCLARTRWDVPEHRGLTMFILEIQRPGSPSSGSDRPTGRWSSARSSSTTWSSPLAK